MVFAFLAWRQRSPVKHTLPFHPFHTIFSKRAQAMKLCFFTPDGPVYLFIVFLLRIAKANAKQKIFRK